MSDNKHVHDENCNHDHDHEHEHEEMEIMTLTLDDETELECAVIGIFEVEDKEYIALLPLGDEDKEEEDEVLLYEYKELAEEEFELALIDDEDEFDLVSEAFYALYTDEHEEEDEE
ncbi:DUF1292 domain-containing protein [Gudongella sp. DL1XJH-153]|uniref:DUF1292 domain-containing protein n=1 Tax=Gudongella sp. DL1XJH-153 TaxID=3409804 RepID=UPI003BB6AEC8